MNNFFKISILLSIVVLLFSCSTQKNRFINRAHHTINTKYNVLFNGKQAFEKGLKQIKEKHQDNFWERLAIEPITFDEDGEENSNSTENTKLFDRAEEKAVKAIQKHSMNFNGFEKNKQIDDAYLLLGKSRYYTQRFIPAIEAFNYIIANYPDANLNYETRIWRAKANTRLGNEGTAIQTMNLLIGVLDENETIPDNIKEQAHTALAMAYSQTDTIEKAIFHLKQTQKTCINKEQYFRNQFILGQIYNELGYKDSARVVFKKLSENGRTPKKYRVQSNIELVKNTVRDSSDVLLISKIKKLIKNSENSKFYNELYYQLGALYEGKGYTKKAIELYNKSLKAKQNTNYQKTYSYESLANIYFKKQDYLLAGNYYDSVLEIVPKKYEQEKRIRQIKKKNKNLSILKEKELLVKENDSVLKLTNMSADKQKSFFENHIKNLKKAEKEQQQRLANSQSFGNAFLGSNSFIKTKKKKGKWYFYNTQSKQFGKADFEKIWGNRPLEDNWRTSSKRIISNNQTNTTQTNNTAEKKYDLDFYLGRIPKDSTTINKLIDERNETLYHLGLLYKEQFKNNEIAIEKLERLKKLNTKEALILPTTYQLYQLYSEEGETKKAADAKNSILTKYADSRFAKSLNNENQKEESDSNENEDFKKYKLVYQLYKNNQFEDAVNQSDKFINTINNPELVRKTALIRALAIGKYQDKKAFKNALSFVLLSYPNSEEGQKAKEIINQIK